MSVYYVPGTSEGEIYEIHMVPDFSMKIPRPSRRKREWVDVRDSFPPTILHCIYGDPLLHVWKWLLRWRFSCHMICYKLAQSKKFKANCPCLDSKGTPMFILPLGLQQWGVSAISAVFSCFWSLKYRNHCYAVMQRNWFCSGSSPR